MSSAKVDLRRARIVEFNRSDGKGWQLTVIRIGHGASFRVMAINNDVEHHGVGNVWTEQDIHAHGVNITVLAEFPVTLADLLPKGCTRFEFNDGVLGTAYYARRFGEDPHHYRDDFWNVTAIVGDAGGAFKLGDLARRFDIDLNTVVPLTVHPDWIEAQR